MPLVRSLPENATLADLRADRRLHSRVAAGFGIDEKIFTPLDERLKPVLRYVRKLTETPA